MGRRSGCGSSLTQQKGGESADATSDASHTRRQNKKNKKTKKQKKSGAIMGYFQRGWYQKGVDTAAAPVGGTLHPPFTPPAFLLTYVMSQCGRSGGGEDRRKEELSEVVC